MDLSVRHRSARTLRDVPLGRRNVAVLSAPKSSSTEPDQNKNAPSTVEPTGTARTRAWLSLSKMALTSGSDGRFRMSVLPTETLSPNTLKFLNNVGAVPVT